MRRFQLFEFEDLHGFPAALRDCITDYLRFVSNEFHLFDPTVPRIAALLERTGRREIVDLGSGGGGAWPTIGPMLGERIEGLTVTLTDLHPNREALQYAVQRAPDVLRFEEASVDATAVPARLKGVRTQFLSLHHFRPEAARQMLANAVAAGEPIAVFEANRRDIGTLARFALVPLAVLVLTPRIRPFRWSRIFLTYLPPLVPIFTLWDGLVSVLRTYNHDEMLAMAHEADPDDRFVWESGEITESAVVVPYLIGWPAGA